MEALFIHAQKFMLPRFQLARVKCVLFTRQGSYGTGNPDVRRAKHLHSREGGWLVRGKSEQSAAGAVHDCSTSQGHRNVSSRGWRSPDTGIVMTRKKYDEHSGNKTSRSLAYRQFPIM